MNGKKVLLITLEVIVLAILTIGIYWGAIRLIFAFGNAPIPLIFFVLTIVLDVLYLSTVKFWSIRNIHIKIIVALLLFACTAAIITIYLMPLNFGF